MLNTTYIALGSNIGRRHDYLYTALRKIKDNPNIEIVDFSSIYETEPVGYEDQDQFLNMVIKVNTNLQPFDLLTTLQDIEKELGRKREIKWGPRTIDLDILLYNQENIESERLIVPHPRMHERAFVIIPLLEIDKDFTVPKIKESLFQLDKLPDKEGVHLWKRKNGEDVFELFES